MCLGFGVSQGQQAIQGGGINLKTIGGWLTGALKPLGMRAIDGNYLRAAKSSSKKDELA